MAYGMKEGKPRTIPLLTRKVLDRVQVNMPYRLLREKYLSFVLDNGINPEIGFDCFVLDNCKKKDVQRTAAILAEAALSITFHAPFYDLRPGALDSKIREITIGRFKKVFELAPLFRPKTVVCHAAFDRRYYISHEEQWLENSVKTWKIVAEMAEKAGTMVALENTYEDTPEYFGRLLDFFSGDPRVTCCFDTGHCSAFSTAPFRQWMDRIGERIGQVHLHDNDGSGDMHLPPGEGNFPFQDFFDHLAAMGISPVITLEPHRERDLWKSVAALSSMKLPAG